MSSLRQTKPIRLSTLRKAPTRATTNQSFWSQGTTENTEKSTKMSIMNIAMIATAGLGVLSIYRYLSPLDQFNSPGFSESTDPTKASTEDDEQTANTKSTKSSWTALDAHVKLPRDMICSRIQHAISCNNTLILHGPPLSGKTGAVQLALERKSCEIFALPMSSAESSSKDLLDGAFRAAKNTYPSMHSLCEKMANVNGRPSDGVVLVIQGDDPNRIAQLLDSCREWKRRYPFLKIIVEVSQPPSASLLEGMKKNKAVCLEVPKLTVSEKQVILYGTVYYSPLRKAISRKEFDGLMQLASENIDGNLGNVWHAVSQLGLAKNVDEARKIIDESKISDNTKVAK